MESELLHKLALSMIPGCGTVAMRMLLDQFGDARNIFKLTKSEWRKLDIISEQKYQSILNFDWSLAEHELRFVEESGINIISLQDEKYPRRLLNCHDCPIVLFQLGQADLNTARMVSIIGTRHNSAYGKLLVDKLLADLSESGVSVISGLAYGIDALAHYGALRNNLPTIGVLAHGLDRIYPYKHGQLAKEMVDAGGGLLTEYRSGTAPDRYNFPSRNRIVAGICDATIVVETALRGGSMITAELANGYNRDVFAFPGRATDRRSAGCNEIIRKNKAVLITEAKELLELLGWNNDAKSKTEVIQSTLFQELSPNELAIYKLLKTQASMHIDEINSKAELSVSAVAAAILSMELAGTVIGKPGKLFSLANG